jgi:hypothetical protein
VDQLRPPVTDLVHRALPSFGYAPSDTHLKEVQR